MSAQSMPLAAESAVRRAATPLLTWAWEQFGEQFGEHLGGRLVDRLDQLVDNGLQTVPGVDLMIIESMFGCLTESTALGRPRGDGAHRARLRSVAPAATSSPFAVHASRRSQAGGQPGKPGLRRLNSLNSLNSQRAVHRCAGGGGPSQASSRALTFDGSSRLFVAGAFGLR